MKTPIEKARDAVRAMAHMSTAEKEEYLAARAVTWPTYDYVEKWCERRYYEKMSSYEFLIKVSDAFELYRMIQDRAGRVRDQGKRTVIVEAIQ